MSRQKCVRESTFPNLTNLGHTDFTSAFLILLGSTRPFLRRGPILPNYPILSFADFTFLFAERSTSCGPTHYTSFSLSPSRCFPMSSPLLTSLSLSGTLPPPSPRLLPFYLCLRLSILYSLFPLGEISEDKRVDVIYRFSTSSPSTSHLSSFEPYKQNLSLFSTNGPTGPSQFSDKSQTKDLIQVKRKRGDNSWIKSGVVVGHIHVGGD